MKACGRIGICVFALIAISACAYKVAVNGYLPPGGEAVPSGARICVVKDKGAANPLLEGEVARKIGALLVEKGYRVVGTGEAEFYLAFDYSMDGGRVRNTTIPFTKRIYTYNPHTGTSDFETVTTYQSSATHLYGRFLSLQLIRIGDRRKADVRDAETGEAEVVWAADVMSEGKSGDLREVVNYLLVAAFEYFGEDTGKAVNVRMIRGDRRVDRLKGE